MDNTDFAIAETKNGPRVHRTSCKRLPAKAVPLYAALRFAPGTVALAQSAGCCKPRGWQEFTEDIPSEAVDAAAQAAEGAKHFTPDRPDEEPMEDLIGGDAYHTNEGTRMVSDAVNEYLDNTDLWDDGEEPIRVSPPFRPSDGQVTVTLPYTGGAKHWWASLVVVPAKEISQALGVKVRTSSKEQSVTITANTQHDADGAANVFQEIWGGAANDIATIKATDTEWQGLPKASAAAYDRIRLLLARGAQHLVRHMVEEGR